MKAVHIKNLNKGLINAEINVEMAKDGLASMHFFANWSKLMGKAINIQHSLFQI